VKALLLIPLITALAYAQDSDLLELRGVVLEIGANAPLAGAQVTVYQFAPNLAKTVFGTIVTDSSGAFQFKPTRPGKYYVEAAKPDYFASAVDLPVAIESPPSTTGALITLSKEHPSEDLRLALMRFGELRGKVVDDDGKPLSRLRVDLIPQTSAAMLALVPALAATRTARSEADGSFLAKGLAPGNYIVRVSTGPTMKRPQTDFSADDENAVDEDFATSYWPGAADRASAGTATVSPGGSLDLGNIRLHKEPRYRIHFVVHGCEPGDQVSLAGPQDDDFLQTMKLLEFAGGGKLPGLSEPALPCRDLLVGGLAAGSYRFVATTQHGAAVTPLTITDRNVTAPMTLIADGDVLGRVVTVSGDPPPPRQPTLEALSRTHISPDAKGNFTITGVRCLPAELMLNRLDQPYYIKEFRIDGVAVSGGPVTLCAGSRLEIVLDNKTAALAVSVNAPISPGDKPATDPIVVVRRWPESPMDPMVKSGTLNLTQLAPGDYRVLAVRPVVLADGRDVQTLIPQLWDHATKITLGPGDAKSISVNVIDPFL
jgi:Carboxypeptidase regulatory-like domain